MDTFGQHLLVEYFECEDGILNNEDSISSAMQSAAIAAGATIVQRAFHRFAPQGISGVLVIEESHLSIHTWPEFGYAAVDFYTCGDYFPEKSHEVLKRALGARRSEVLEIHRGTSLRHQSIRIQRHYEDRSAAEGDGHGALVLRDV